MPRTTLLTVCLLSAGALAAHASAQLQLSTNDLVYDSYSRTILASVPSSVGLPRGNSITTIDPFRATVGASVFVGSEPGAMAVSDDGHWVYVSLNGAAAVRRYDIRSATADIQFPLGSDPFFGPFYVEDLDVAPGRADTLAVSRKNLGISPRHAGVAIYVDGTELPNATPRHTGSNVIEFSDSPGTLYGYNNETTEFGFRTMAVDAMGVTVASVAQSLITGFGVDIEYGGGLVFASNGTVVDPRAQTVAGVFTGASGILEPDPRNGRVFYLTGSGSTRTLRAYDIATFVPIGSETISGVSGTATSLIRWGIDGIAFRTSTGQVFLHRTRLIRQVALEVSPNRPSYSAGDPFRLSLDVANNGSNQIADLYLGIVLPDGSVIYFRDVTLAVGVGTLALPSQWQPLATGIPLSTPFTVETPELVSFVWGSGLPPTTYTFFGLLTTTGADNQLDPGELIDLSVAPITSM